MVSLFPRYSAKKLDQVMQHMRVCLVVGPRRSGKTTLVTSYSRANEREGSDREYFSLDDPATLSLARSDPEGFIESLPPYVTIDEVQNAIDIILPIKMSVDADQRPGRFLLTGSANVMLLPRLADSLAGRMSITNLLPLAQAEIERRTDSNLIDEVFDPKFKPQIRTIGEPRNDTLARVLTGGYPEAVSRSNNLSEMSQWFDSYTDSILRRDIRDIVSVEKVFDMDRLLRLLASRNTGLINYADLSRSLGLAQTTIKRYFYLLELVFLVRRVPAWHKNIGVRSIKSPKVYFTDTGLWANLIDAGAGKVMGDTSLTGSAFENFVGIEIAKLAEASRTRPTLYHWRSKQSHKVDIVLESGGGTVIAVEAKASASVDASDLKGIKKLRDGIKGNFLRGMVIYTGKNILPLESDIWAIPVTALWKGAFKPSPQADGAS